MLPGIAFSRALNAADQVTLDVHLNTLHDLGVRVVRLEASLYSRSAWDTQTLNDLHTLVTRIQGRGIQVLVLLTGQLVPRTKPENWRAPVGSSQFQHYLSAFVAAAGLLAQTLPSEYWEVWNEPNVAGTAIPPENYGLLLTQTARAIRLRNPKAQVIGGSLFQHNQAKFRGATWANAGMDYLRAVLEAPGMVPSAIDALSIHPYLCSGGVLDAAVLGQYVGYLRTLSRLPVWITEAGWDSTVTTETVQAGNVTTLLQTAKGLGLAGCCYFSLMDEPAGLPPLPGIGLIRKYDTGHKLSYGAFKAAVVR